MTKENKERPLYDAEEHHTAGDEDIDFSNVDVVQAQIDEIAAIEDDDERMAAAKLWVKRLNGEEV